MPLKRYSPREIEALKKLKSLRAAGGEDPDLEGLPDLPGLPEPESETTIAIFIPSAETSPEAGDDELQDEELVEDEPEEEIE